MNLIKYISWWDRLRLIFTRRQVFWDHDSRTVSVFKRKDGVVYLFHQEPIAYGDQRNEQIFRLDP